MSTSSIGRESNFGGIELEVVRVPLAKLKPGPNQLRRHTKQQIRQIARSITEHGFVVPITVYGDNIIASGMARWEAAMLLRLSDVPVRPTDAGRGWLDCLG